MALTYQIGTTYVAFTKIDVSDLGCGYQIIDSTSENFYVLASSTAAIDHVNAEAVLNRPDLRWLKTGQNATTPLGPSAWLTNAKVYVSPEGSDTNDGTSETAPKQHVYQGLQALIALGGGTLYVSDGAVVGDGTGGSVAGQGLRLRSDLVPGGAFTSAGFLPLTVPIRIVGAGSGNGLGPFAAPTPAIFHGGGSRRDPSIWIVGSTSMPPLLVENLQQASSNETGVRCGVDYDRNVDGSIRDITVASASRTDTSTTYTMTLPAGFTVAQAERSGGFTTLHLTNPGLPWPPFRGAAELSPSVPSTFSTPIRFTTSDPSFTSGDYVLTGTSNFLADNTNWTITFRDATAGTVALRAITATVQTHGLCQGELLDLTSTDPHFESVPYMVDSFPTSPVDATRVTVTDAFNTSGNQTGTNIGTIAHEERFYCGTTNVRFREVSVNVAQSIPTAGPSWDIGHTVARKPEVIGGWMNGWFGVPFSSQRDERRMAAMYVYSGGAGGYGPPSSSVYVHDGAGSGGSIYVQEGPAGIGVVVCQRFLMEQPESTSIGLPALRVDGGSMSVFADLVENDDDQSGAPSVQLNGVSPSSAHVTRCGLNFPSGACVGGDSWFSPGAWMAQSPGASYPNPWTRQQVTAWADGRITGKHPGVARAMGVMSARYKNIVLPSSSWVLGGGVTLSSVATPDGNTTGADQLVSTIPALTQIFNSTDGNTWAAGGQFYVCGWVNIDDPSHFPPGQLLRVDLSGGDTWVESGSSTGNISPGYTGPGWQFFSTYLTVAASVPSATPTIIIRISTLTGTIQFWGLNAAYVPPGSANDAAEYLGTLRHQPRYLKAGMSGTMEGTKLIAHGGLGTAARYVVGGSSGQITLGGANGKAVELFDESGNSLGVAVLQSFTVNP